MSLNYYQLLNVERNADTREIKKAYFKLAHKYHPDKNSDPNAHKLFTEIKKAYEVLSNETERMKYDKTLDFKKEKKPFFDGTFVVLEDVEEEIEENPYNLQNFSLLLINKFDSSAFENYFLNISLEQAINAYSFFWKSFWGMGKINEAILLNNSAISIFESFETYFKGRVNLIDQFKSINYNNENIFDIIANYKNSFHSIDKGTKYLSRDAALYYMLDIINRSETFRNDNFMFFSFELKDEIKIFFKKITYLYHWSIGNTENLKLRRRDKIKMFKQKEPKVRKTKSRSYVKKPKKKTIDLSWIKPNHIYIGIIGFVIFAFIFVVIISAILSF